MLNTLHDHSCTALKDGPDIGQRKNVYSAMKLKTEYKTHEAIKRHQWEECHTENSKS